MLSQWNGSAVRLISALAPEPSNIVDHQSGLTPGNPGLLRKLVRSWSRDKALGLRGRLRKAARVTSELAKGWFLLRSFDRLGRPARVYGRVRVENLGVIEAGTALGIIGPFVPVELLTGPQGRINIGDSVWINFGSVVAARSSVSIGSHCMIGQYCIISDIDVPEQFADKGKVEAKPIRIEDRVWLAGRVTVRPGVTIGAGSVVIAGSIVESDIPPGVIAGGIPARVLRALGDAPAGPSQAQAPVPAAAVAATAPVAVPEPRFSGLLISDFTIDDLAPELLKAGELPPLSAAVAPFGQVTQQLLQAALPGGEGADFAVVWTRAESAIPQFARIAGFEDVAEADLLAEVDAHCELIANAATRFKGMFVPTWQVNASRRGLGLVDGRPGGAARALAAMNLRLMQKLAQVDNVFVLDAARWFRAVPAAAHDAKAWYLGKMAVPRLVLAEAAADIRAGMVALSGGTRKLLVLDLDDTMWGGIVGDMGWENLQLGTVSAEGEAFVDFQRAVRDLKRRGIVLAIVSKNEESVALEAIRQHPEMVLRQEDFVAWRINWTDKARNIADLCDELNLGLQSVVFIDDNPVERKRVRDELPEVLVPEWPVDKFQYRSALEGLRCFDAVARTKEDMERTRMYAEEQQRERLKTQVGSLSEWLKGLGMKVKVEPVGPANLARATQLLNKTNQLNLSTRRLTEAELVEWAQGQGRAFWTVSVSDRLGDAGLTGLLSVEREGNTARVVDFVLSCRVMGRKVEETLAHLAVASAAQLGAKRVVAEYLLTPKNKPCLSFWKQSGFANEGDKTFTWEMDRSYEVPEAIELEWRHS
jgi:FkbH-like protein